MLFAQISDPHIVGPGEKTRGVAPAGANLSRAIAHINAMEPRPQFALVTGDVTGGGEAAHAKEAARLLDAFEIPYLVTPGNHDRRETLRAAFDEEALPARDGPFLHYSFEHGGARFIGVDTTGPDTPGGVLCEARAEWLEETLARAPEQPAVLFMHHPPVKFGILETDADGFEGADLLGDIVERHKNVKALLCGHTHLSLFTLWRGVMVSTAPAVSGMRLSLDLTMKKPSAFHLDDPAFHLHKWTAETGLLSYCVTVRENETTHLF